MSRALLLTLLWLPLLVQARPLELAAGDFIAVDSARLPADDDPRWRPITLPDHWREPGRFDHGHGGWYRFRLDAAPPQQPWAIYLYRLGMNAAVYFNRDYLGDGGAMEDPVTRNWNTPLLFVIPPALWRSDTPNTVYVRLRGYPHYIGILPPLVGPADELRPRYEWRRTLQNSVGYGLFIFTLAIALFSLYLWLRRRADTLYLWFGLATTCWSLYSMNLGVRDIPLSAHDWLALVHGSTDWWVITQAIFVHRFVGTTRHRVERGLLGLGATLTLFYLIPDFHVLRYTSLVGHLLSIVICLYSVAQLVGAWRRHRRIEHGLFAVGLALVVLLGIHDWALTATRSVELFKHSLYLAHFAVPIVFGALSWHLTGRFLKALHEAERLNRELESRVQQARGELEENYQQRRSLERQKAAAAERELIFRDLHDDLGAKLLTLVYRTSEEDTAGLARSALQDLRDVVSRSSQGPLALGPLATAWQEEARARLRDSGIALNWHQSAPLDDVVITPLQGYHLERILREAVSNAIKHSGARQLDVFLDQGGQRELRLCVEDDGEDFDPARSTGRGIGNMTFRARSLGAEIRWRLTELGGCHLRLTLPLGADQPSEF